MINGVTDRPILRWDGKIRAGLMKPGARHPENTPYFVMNDAPQLIPILGERPTEIYITVPLDDVNEIATSDLRWYSANELICQSKHDYKDLAEKGLAQVAAYYQAGTGVSGLTTHNFPNTRARIRKCDYRTCPNYTSDKECSEHTLLKTIVPEYSMSSLFAFESMSILALLSIQGAIQKAQFANLMKGRKISGEIFRLFKQDGPISFMNDAGKRSKSEKPLVWMEHVPFRVYEEKFKEKMPPENWEQLMFLRSMVPAQTATLISIPAAPALTAIAGAMPPPDTETPPQGDPDKTDMFNKEAQASAAAEAEAALTARAEDPQLTELFNEIAGLMKMQNSAGARRKTAENFGTVQEISTYLKTKIASIKKKAAEAQTTTTATVVTPPTPQQQNPVTAPAQSGGIY